MLNKNYISNCVVSTIISVSILLCLFFRFFLPTLTESVSQPRDSTSESESFCYDKVMEVDMF